MHELHLRAGEMLAGNVRGIEDEHWHLPTPCSEWDVRDLVHHIAKSNFWVAPLVEGRSLQEVAPTLKGDVLGPDPIDSCVRSVEEASSAFASPGAMDRKVQLSRGPTPGREYCFERMNDLLVHNWDLARAVGGDEELDEECMAVALAGFRPLEAELRAAGDLGPNVSVPPDADLQTRYLAFFGRSADWHAP